MRKYKIPRWYRVFWVIVELSTIIWFTFLIAWFIIAIYFESLH